MNGNARMAQLVSYVLLQVVAHSVSLFHADIPGHYQVQVNIALVARLASAQSVKIYQGADMFQDAGPYKAFLSLR